MYFRQMTYINEDTDVVVNNNMKVGSMSRHRYPNSLGGSEPNHRYSYHSNANDRDDVWNKDIAKQVDSWMRKKTVSDGQHAVHSLLPMSSLDNGRTRRQKRHRLREADEHTETGSTTGVESVISGSTCTTDKSVSTKLSNSDKKFNPTSSFSKPDYKYMSNKHGPSSVDEAPTRINNSYGHAYNEIEFQKRYRRVFDLKKHLQFVNSTCLSGQKIVRKGNSLPPMSGRRKDPERELADDLLAISSVKRYNEPPPVTDSLMHVSRVSSETRVPTKSVETSPWIAGKRPLMEKYDRLPHIPGKLQKRVNVEDQKTSDSNNTSSVLDSLGVNGQKKEVSFVTRNSSSPKVSSDNDTNNGSKSVEEIHDDRRKSDSKEDGTISDALCNTPSHVHSSPTDKCNVTPPNSENTHRTLTSTHAVSEATNRTESSSDTEEEDNKSEISEYEPTPGMKICIHIKYKNDFDVDPLKDTVQMKTKVKHRHDDNTKGVPNILITESELKHISK